MNAKPFKLSAPQIRRLIPPMGGSIATDTITVDGRRVGHMLRSPPHNAQDSGWQFMAGGETQAYIDEAGNHGIYDLNTIANYDPSIIEFLTYPVGTDDRVRRASSAHCLSLLRQPGRAAPSRLFLGRHEVHAARRR